MKDLVTTNTENQSMKNRILYMDDDIAVLNKLPGEICELWTKESHEEKKYYLPDILLQYLHENNAGKESCQCFNRLDRPVSGAVLLVFNTALISVLQNQFTAEQKERKSLKKTYRLIVEGIIPKMNDYELLKHFIRFDGSKQKAFVYDEEKRKTKEARLLWRSLGHGDRYSFIEAELLTGRTHQIRAQLAHIGLHVKGDVKYGARRQDTLPGIRLHSAKLCFVHPLTGNTVEIDAPLLHIDSLWQAFLSCF